jgi:peptidoglycan/xylan/chitin deacetylase (PgdA/CDA1 family)
MLRNYYGRGIAYHFGLSLAESVLLPQTGGDYEAQRSFVNTVEPSADTVMLLLKALYEAIVPQAVYLSPIPSARPTALLLSHDVDAQTSFVDSLKFAALAEEFGARSTFFINTKYYENWMDIAYYTLPENKRALQRLSLRGHELGSHTVAHALEFNEAAPGSPEVSFRTYAPQQQITINGEVRVSKQLLDRDIAGQNTVSFRAGYLAFPPELISILAAAGYKYDSSFSANDVLTTFPYFALPQRQPGAEESSIIEIPVTFDDALGYLTPERRQAAVRQWKQVVKAHAANETISVLLVHPSDTRTQTYKLQAQRELMEYARSLDAWMGSIREFGDFWRARHQLRITRVNITPREAPAEARLEIHLSRSVDQLHPWTGLVLPGAARVAVRDENVQIIDSGGENVPFTSRTARGKLYLSLQPR